MICAYVRSVAPTATGDSFSIWCRTPSRCLRWVVVTTEDAPYGMTTEAADGQKRVRTRHFRRAKEQGIKITGLTSYDFLSASIFDRAGIDFLLVGDSAGNAVFGYDTTLPVTSEELLPLCRAVVRACRRALVVADMPFGSYEVGPDEALHTAIRFMKEAGAHAVKLEGGRRSARQIEHIVTAGIPVMAHIGYTPQSEHGLGGHIIQGRGEAASELLADAHAVEEAGAFAVVLEMVPSAIAGQVTKELSIPTISVGAGPQCDGQLMVWTDWAGFTSGRIPKFVKQYANVAESLHDAAVTFRTEVEAGEYPGPEHEYEG
jgi:3-methyl-2-oxobutanoate hydroxymethyltransferase